MTNCEQQFVIYNWKLAKGKTYLGSTNAVRSCTPFTRSAGPSQANMVITPVSCHEVGRNEEIHWEEFSTMDSTLQLNYRLRALNQNLIDE